MVDIIGYLSVCFMVIISGAGLYPDFFTNTKRRTRIILSVFLAVATGLAVYTLHVGNFQHAQDSGHIVALQNEVKNAEGRQQRSAQQFIQGQKETATTFAKNYGELSKRLSDLQAGIKTADLQKEADGLRKELKATQHALVAPKAKLTLSLTNTINPVLSESLPVKDNVVHIGFYVMNNGMVNALDGDVVLFICRDCSYVKVPTSFIKLNGSADYQRNYTFQRILAHSTTQRFEADIRIKPMTSKWNSEWLSSARPVRAYLSDILARI